MISSSRPRYIPTIISHLAVVGKFATLPLPLTSGPQAGPTLAMAVQAAVSAVRGCRPVSASPTISTPKVSTNSVNSAMTELTTSGSSRRPCRLKSRTRLGDCICASCALSAWNST